MANEIVLVTGAGGFVGSHIFNAIGETTNRVAIVRDRQKRVLPEGIISNGDLRNDQFVKRVVLEYRPDVVIHCAASAIVNQGLQNPLEMYESNILGTLNLLEACKMLGKQELQFIYFSTDKVLGDREAADEGCPYRWEAMGPYEQSKAMSEVLCSRYAEHFKICTTRSGNIYGPGDSSNRLIPNDIQWAMFNGITKAYNRDTRQYVYIDDVVRAVKLLIEKKSTGIWHIGSTDILTTLQVAQEIASFFPNCKVQEDTDKIAEAHKYLYYIRHQWLDFRKIATLGWFPQIRFKQGIALTIDWWKEKK